MQHEFLGTIHFHSKYSHDGRSTLREIASALSQQNLSFAVMTEHFEDFDASKCVRYIREAVAISRETGFLLIPAFEVELSGLHTIVFPVQDYAQIARLAAGETDREHSMFKLLAHPAKYPLDRVLKHLDKYAIDGIELWNQEADGRYLPPFDFLESMKTHPRRDHYTYFFGCDIHNANLKVANVLSVSASVPKTSDAVLKALMTADFSSRNMITGIQYTNGSGRISFDVWLEQLGARQYHRAKLRRSVRRSLRSAYKMLPRGMQRSLNDIKNYVRHKL